jgi:large subunit ribosomal protein L24
MATAKEHGGRRVHVRKGDTVVVLSGKDAGKKGKILRALPDEGRVVVEGLNMVKKHTRPSRKMTQGGIISQEAPLYSAKVMLVCSHCGRPTRVVAKVLPDGKTVRACRRCGQALDK